MDQSKKTYFPVEIEEYDLQQKIDDIEAWIQQQRNVPAVSGKCSNEKKICDFI